MDERRLDSVMIRVDGSPLEEALYDAMQLVRVEESVQLPDEFVIRFDDPFFAVFDAGTFTMGTAIEIAFRAEGDLVVVTSGEITSLVVDQPAGGRHQLVVQGLDPSHRMAKGPKTRTFMQMSASDVVAQIAGDYGFETNVESTSLVLDYQLQANQTDYAYCRQLAIRHGFELWFAENTLHFGPRPTAANQPGALEWGDNLQKFRVRFSSTERCDEVRVRGWDAGGARTIDGLATDGHTGTDASAAAELGSDARRAFGDVSRFVGNLPVASQGEADAIAQSLMHRAAGDGVAARGEAVGDPRLAAGASVEMQSLGVRLSGSYTLTSVEHVYGAGQPYVTRFVAGGRDPASMVDLLSGSSSISTAAGHFGGVTIGVVTNSDDPDGMARVKVKLPTLSEQDESTWARVVGLGAGDSRGVLCIPEVGDEVIVAFEHEDRNRPIVLGGVWNADSAPGHDQLLADGAVALRAWRSRLGHMLLLSDGTGDQNYVALNHHNRESLLKLSEDEVRLECTGSTFLTCGSSGELSGDEITISATQKLVLNAPQIEISGDASVKISGGMIELN